MLSRQRWYDEGRYGHDTLGAVMARGVQNRPDTPLIFHLDGRIVTVRIADIYARAGHIACGLDRRGFRSGDRLAVQLPNWVEASVAYCAALRLGLVIVPIPHIYGPSEVGFILRQSKARGLIIPDRWRNTDYGRRLDELGPTPALDQVIVVGEESPAGTTTWLELEMSSDETVADVAPVSADDVCMVLYTSGTTVDPKGVRHSHNTLLSELRSMNQFLGLGEREVYLQGFPAGHMAGVLGMTLSIYLRRRHCRDGRVERCRRGRVITAYRCTTTGGTPFYLSTLLDAAEGAGQDISSLGEFVIGAAGVPPALIERADEAGIAVFRAFGSTEHPSVSSGRATDPITKRAFTDGSVLPGNRVRIVDDDENDVPVGHDGEVVTDGPELMLGYTDPALNDESFLPGGWFRTGDVGHLDAEGFLTITDRRKDIIIRGGEKLSSKEIEDILARHPAVNEVAVVAAADPLYGERPCAFVIPVQGAGLTIEDVRRHFVEAGVARQKTPERLEIVDDFPRTALGKVKKFDLRTRLSRDEHTDANRNPDESMTGR